MTGKTYVTFLLDRTGSMESIKDDTIGGFNAYLRTLKEADDPDSILFSLIQFDSNSTDTLISRRVVTDVPELTSEMYQPRAMTPLIDAAYKTIKAVEKVVGQDDKVVICIQTDGFENASVEYTDKQLAALVKEKTELGWQFNFMGASIDAYKQSRSMGIGAAQTMSYRADDAVATADAFMASAENARGLASGTLSSTAYTEQQRAKAKDEYWDPNKFSSKKVKEDEKDLNPIVDDVKI